MRHHDACWEILDIDAIRDKKAIKKAYARKLKVTRPDADPDGFKALNAAYQECLSYLDYDWYWEEYDEEDSDDEYDDWEEPHENLTDDAEPTVISDKAVVAVTLDNVSEQMNASLKPVPVATAASAASDTSQHTPAEANAKPISQPTHSESVAPDSDRDLETDTGASTAETDVDDEFDMEALLKPFADAHDEQDIRLDASESQQQFIQRIDHLFASPTQLNDLDAWQQLLQDDVLYDISFKQRISLYVLDKLLTLRGEQIEQVEDSDMRLPPSMVHQPVLQALDGFFGWQHNQERLESHFYYQYAALNQLYDDLEPESTEVSKTHFVEQVYQRGEVAGYQLASLPQRFAAYAIDLAISFLPAYGLYHMGNMTWAAMWLFGGILFLYFTVILQCMTRQASLGQRICRLKMLHIQDKPLHFIDAFSRFFATSMILAGTVATFVYPRGGFFFLLGYFYYKVVWEQRLKWLDEFSSLFVVRVNRSK